MRRAGQRANGPAPAPQGNHEYAFLVGRLIDAATLERAETEAVRSGVAVHEVLLATGWVGQADYAAQLARAIDVPFASWDAEIALSVPGGPGTSPELGYPATVKGWSCRALPATQATPETIRRRIGALRAGGFNVALVPGSCIDAATEAALRQERIDRAVRDLLRGSAASSAGARIWTWQIVAAACCAGLTIGGLAVLPDVTIAGLSAMMGLIFLCVVLLRVVALFEAVVRPTIRARKVRAGASRQADQELPVYSVLVPLFREASVLPGLIQSLRTLDYPPAKLDVVLALEAVDTETQAALLALELPGYFRTLIVPDHPPHTKPKALNYALQFARGDFVVVYDAEDRPQPDQLRRALEVFRRAPAGLGCVQAQLNIYNPRRSWVTRGIMAQTPETAG